MSNNNNNYNSSNLIDLINDREPARSANYYYLPLYDIEFKSYTPKIVDYFYNIYPHVPRIRTEPTRNTFWNPVPNEDIAQYFPELVRALEPHLGPIRQVAILALYMDESTLHTDHTVGLNAGVEARVNIPLLNTEGSTTAFYNIPRVFPSKTSRGGTVTWPSELRYTLTPAAQVDVNQATVLRISNPHTVQCKHNLFPRLTLTVSFEQDAVNLLNKE